MIYCANEGEPDTVALPAGATGYLLKGKGMLRRTSERLYGKMFKSCL